MAEKINKNERKNLAEIINVPQRQEPQEVWDLLGSKLEGDPKVNTHIGCLHSVMLGDIV